MREKSEVSTKARDPSEFPHIGENDKWSTDSSSSSWSDDSHNHAAGTVGGAEHGSGGADGSPGKFRRYPRLGSPSHASAAQFFFNIGYAFDILPFVYPFIYLPHMICMCVVCRSVDSFERKLEDAQVSLGIERRDFIPVLYVSETNWMQEMLR